jgi:hypothetical protein
VTEWQWRRIARLAAIAAAVAAVALAAAIAFADTVETAEGAALRLAREACGERCAVFSRAELNQLAVNTVRLIDEAHMRAELAATENAQLRRELAKCR